MKTGDIDPIVNWKVLARVLEADTWLKDALEKGVVNLDNQIAKIVVGLFVTSLKRRGLSTKMSDDDYGKAVDWYFSRNDVKADYIHLRARPTFIRWWHRLFK